MKKLFAVIIALLINIHAFALNPAEVDVTVTINKPPNIENYEPQDGDVITEGDELIISVSAEDPNQDTLNYQFYINDELKKSWTLETEYKYRLTSDDIGQNRIKAEVTDGMRTVATPEVKIYVFRRTLAVPE